MTATTAAGTAPGGAGRAAPRTAGATASERDRPVPPAGVPAAPALPADLEAVLRRLRLPHIRGLAPEVLATEVSGGLCKQGSSNEGVSL